MASITNVYINETDLSKDADQNGGKLFCSDVQNSVAILLRMAACNLRANDVARLVNKEDDFDESDNKFLLCGDFNVARGAEVIFPSKFLAPSSVPFY